MRKRVDYAKFRTGKLFFIGFTSFVGFWLCWNTLPFLPHFDSGLSLLNVVLSVEASIATSMLLMAGEGQAALQAKQLEYQLHLMEAMYAQIAKTCVVGDAAAAARGISIGAEGAGEV